jgi:uncharacterized membrane protein
VGGALVALLAVVAPSCGDWTEPEEVECPPEGTALTYENFAQPFFGQWCNGCHSVNVDDRNGAPVAYVFDTYDQVYSLRERIFMRSAAANDSMPPGPDDPPEEEREKLAEWFACGAPARE